MPSAEDRRSLGEILEPMQRLPMSPVEDRRGQPLPQGVPMQPDENAVLSWLLGEMALREGLSVGPMERALGLEDLRRMERRRR